MWQYRLHVYLESFSAVFALVGFGAAMFCFGREGWWTNRHDRTELRPVLPRNVRGSVEESPWPLRRIRGYGGRTMKGSVRLVLPIGEQ